MPGPPRSLDQPPAWLERAVEAIEKGNWRFVLSDLEDVAAHGAAALVLTTVRAVAASMQLQAHGEVLDAWRRLADAARMLPRGCPLRWERGVPLVVLAPPPPKTAALPMLIWRVARVIWREQQDLLALRNTTRRMRAHDVLIAACVHYLVWVEWDRSTWRSPIVGDAPPGIDRTGAEFCARASILRRFDRPTAPDVAWRGFRDYHELHCAALDALAAAGDPPWRSENPLAVAVPLREAFIEARAYAVK